MSLDLMPLSEKEMRTELCVSSREEWRSWLQKNHDKADVVWLVYYKKHTGKPSINYADSVEEALCFGWIDSIKKSIDVERYAYKFTPRRSKSKWSPLNIKRAKKLIDEGRMTQAGLELFNQKVDYSDEFIKARASKELPIPPEIEAALKSNEKVWENFKNLAPGYRKQYIGWLVTAKKPETRERRLKQAIQLLSENKKLV
jgi:uncharacterized protein YdeI (YjbR/CyaY-like superfamily)